MIAVVPVLLVIVAFGLYQWYRGRGLKRRQNEPFPEAWLAMLKSAVPIYGALSVQEQTRLRNLIATFVAEKRFYGCQRLAITDEVRVTIAAQACLLVVNLTTNTASGKQGVSYPGLRSILVYPAAFSVRRQAHNDDGTVVDAANHLSGESWSDGKVILSWDDVEKGVGNFQDGHNVALHEFAHQLDSASGSTNGAPVLRRNSYQSWARVFSANFDDLRRRTVQQQSSVMDAYGGTNPAEFFAVATETFFEMPHQLHEKRPELYAQLSEYYQLDPRQWSEINVH